MRFTFPLAAFALIAAATSVQGAHWAICTNNTNGTGGTNYQVTKDCCAATQEHDTTNFIETAQECMDAVGLGNGLNLGRFIACCGSRGAGSNGE
ncbi:hypothetical protein NDA16_004860 [Ustilago loliicola]|nr:hypothetical protein NDA16_004860 [Ustilago loliicola]